MIKLEKQLKALLSKNGITIAQLARETHVPAKTIYGWISGNNPKDFNQVKKIARYFKVTLDSLVFGEIDSREIELYFPEINAGVYEVVLRKVKDKN